MYKKGDIIEWENIRFEVLHYDKDTGKGIVKCIKKDKLGVWKKGDISKNFNFILGGGCIVIKRNCLTELDYLRIVYNKIEFGFASNDTMNIHTINEDIKKETGRDLPEGYDNEY